jgi:hypothetical protein
MALSPLAEFPTVLNSEHLPGGRARRLVFIGIVKVRAYRAQQMWLAMFHDGRKTAGRSWNRG